MSRSHPTWVRGLKLIKTYAFTSIRASHPTWVRGLKLSVLMLTNQSKVAPYVGAWIETLMNASRYFVLGSHPTWVRGLKRYSETLWPQLFRVAPYVGAWIETAGAVAPQYELAVAPYVGAWIETRLPQQPSCFNPRTHVGCDSKISSMT